MASALDAAHTARWRLVKAAIPYNPDAAIARYWIAHPEIDSPVTAELTDDDDGSVIQAFTNGVLRWRSGADVEVASE